MPRTTGKRKGLVATAVAVAAIVAVPAVHSVAQTGRPTVDVRSYGAVGDGITNDTAAIQRANNAVSEAGGGTVVFPAGMYVAANVMQDSNVEFVGIDDAMLKHADGASGYNIIEGRVFKKTGTIIEGSSRLWVSDTRGVLPGAIVGVRAAGGASPVQTSVLTTELTSKSVSVAVTQKAGWGKRENYLLVDDEVISHSGFDKGTFLNVRRGRLGTTAIWHRAGARISLLGPLYARVVGVGSNFIDLDRVAVQGLRNVDVYVGSINMAVRGLALDGDRTPDGSIHNPVPLKYEFARWVTVEGNTIRKGDHGAVWFDKGTSDSVVTGNTLIDNGVPSAVLGSSVWLFRGSSNNRVVNNDIFGESNVGIMADDRSESATEWDAPSNGNYIAANRIDIPRVRMNAGVWVVGSQDNVAEGNEVSSTERGISVTISTQGTYPATASGTVVRDNRVSGHDTGLFVTGSGNRFERNQISASRQPILAKGTDNQYVENWVG